jgi:hypothetical protein
VAIVDATGRIGYKAAIRVEDRAIQFMIDSRLLCDQSWSELIAGHRLSTVGFVYDLVIVQKLKNGSAHRPCFVFSCAL